MKTLMKVETWLPVFSGFYGTVWETDRDWENEIEWINEKRAKKNLAPVTQDDIEWDYKGYHDQVAKGATRWIGEMLKTAGFISDYAFQDLRSPREYNFTNDAIDVQFTLSGSDYVRIARYLAEHSEKFAKYIADKYTSGPGFISSYSNNAVEWMADLTETLEHEHKLGSVLNFILENEDKEIEMTMYEDLHGNGVILQAKNYDALTEGK
jgi:hypothetical protein